jgi:hypothetical protein
MDSHKAAGVLPSKNRICASFCLQKLSPAAASPRMVGRAPAVCTATSIPKGPPATHEKQRRAMPITPTARLWAGVWSSSEPLGGQISPSFLGSAEAVTTTPIFRGVLSCAEEDLPILHGELSYNYAGKGRKKFSGNRSRSGWKLDLPCGVEVLTRWILRMRRWMLSPDTTRNTQRGKANGIKAPTDDTSPTSFHSPSLSSAL